MTSIKLCNSRMCRFAQSSNLNLTSSTHSTSRIPMDISTTQNLPCILQPLYGFGSKDPARFARAAGHQDLLYIHDAELSFEQVVTLLTCCNGHFIRPVPAVSSRMIKCTQPHLQLPSILPLSAMESASMPDALCNTNEYTSLHRRLCQPVGRHSCL